MRKSILLMGLLTALFTTSCAHRYNCSSKKACSTEKCERKGKSCCAKKEKCKDGKKCDMKKKKDCSGGSCKKEAKK